jgi:hypothetical protein
MILITEYSEDLILSKEKKSVLLFICNLFDHQVQIHMDMQQYKKTQQDIFFNISFYRE